MYYFHLHNGNTFILWCAFPGPSQQLSFLVHVQMDHLHSRNGTARRSDVAQHRGTGMTADPTVPSFARPSRGALGQTGEMVAIPGVDRTNAAHCGQRIDLASVYSGKAKATFPSPLTTVSGRQRSPAVASGFQRSPAHCGQRVDLTSVYSGKA